jgi:hypothetical protein
VVFDKIHSPGHEIGFSPDGKFLVMMNNLRENNARSSVPASSPTKWRKIAHVEDPLWRGKYTARSMVFARDGSKLYLTILHPSPASSGIMVVDTKPGPSSGDPGHRSRLADAGDHLRRQVRPRAVQRLPASASGIAVIDASTDTLIGILPSNGGHHDCVIITTKLEHMKNRSCTL